MGLLLLQEDLQLPHVPRCSVIVGPIRATDRLLRWRAETSGAQIGPRQSITSTPTSPHIPPTFPMAHVISKFRIENSIFVSTGGKRATVYRCVFLSLLLRFVGLKSELSFINVLKQDQLRGSLQIYATPILQVT